MFIEHKTPVPPPTAVVEAVYSDVRESLTQQSCLEVLHEVPLLYFTSWLASKIILLIVNELVTYRNIRSDLSFIVTFEELETHVVVSV